MRRLLGVILAAALCGCGPMKNLDPLGGYGGPTDTARYSFEAGVQGWAKPSVPSSTTFSVTHALGRSIFGQNSLAVAVQSMTKGDPTAGRVSVLLGPAQDLTGKTLTAWFYAPPSSQPDGSIPTYGQIYLKDGSGRTGIGPGGNVSPDNWKQCSFSPLANPTASAVDNGVVYLAAGFDPSNITEIGFQVLVNGTASASFSFSGVFLLDSVTW